MGLFDDIKAQGAEYRLTEEALFAEVLREMESGVRRDGLWAKALSEVDMDDARARALYIKLRVQSLKDEITTFMVAAEREAALRAAELMREQAHQARDRMQSQEAEQRSKEARAAVSKLREKQRQEKTLAEATMQLRRQDMSLEKTLFGWAIDGPQGRVKFSSLDDVDVYARAVDKEIRVKVQTAPKSELQGTRQAIEFLNAVRMLDFRGVEERLIQCRSLIHVSTSEGATALHLAVEEKSEPMTQLLIDAGASPDIADCHGMTPRIAARRQGLIGVLRMFI